MALRGWLGRLRGRGGAEPEAPLPSEEGPQAGQADGNRTEEPASQPPDAVPEIAPRDAGPEAAAAPPAQGVATIEPAPAPAEPASAPASAWGTTPADPPPPPMTAPVEPAAVEPAPVEPMAVPRPGLLGRLFRSGGGAAPEVAPRDEPAPAPAEPEPPMAVPDPEPEAPDPAEAPPAARGGWFNRLRQGLARSTQRLTESITTVFRKRRLDEEALEELEETLITADLGVAASQRIVESFRKTRFGKEVTDEEVKAALAEQIAEILAPVALPMPIDPGRAPHVVLVVGVNGTGKTTTIAKLGQQYREQGLSCAFVAGDTFRAAAVEQLQIWGGRTGSHVYAPAKDGADAAGLAYDALKAAREAGTQVLLVDTAGRLHNKAALMEELRKIVRVIRRLDPEAPHSVLLTLDATTGQNALQQCRVFKEMVEVTGLAVTKLDGSAKGGVVVALAQEIGVPVHFVGVGEGAQDLRPFEAREFARGLVGLDAG